MLNSRGYCRTRIDLDTKIHMDVAICITSDDMIKSNVTNPYESLDRIEHIGMNFGIGFFPVDSNPFFSFLLYSNDSIDAIPDCHINRLYLFANFTSKFTRQMLHLLFNLPDSLFRCGNFKLLHEFHVAFGSNCRLSISLQFSMVECDSL